MKKILTYDVRSLPAGKTIQDLKNEYSRTGVVEWDSTNGGTEPAILEFEGKENPIATPENIRIIDVG